MVRVVKPPTKDEMSVGWAAPHPMAKVLPSLMDTSVSETSAITVARSRKTKQGIFSPDRLLVIISDDTI